MVARIHDTVGSSPLSRGIRRSRRKILHPGGIIPALAGNTSSPPSRKPPTGDHPRSRGEYDQSRRDPEMPQGSSPLSRGILPLDEWHQRHPRIIPALAGNTKPRPSRRSQPADHPRSRGEYSVNTTHANPTAGSSPLSRGILGPVATPDPAGGIIPALAGNTQNRYRRRGRVSDHPRSRGEYGNRIRIGFLQWGSSPLSRGIQFHASVCHGHCGIIPALAGNTGWRPMWWSPEWDHPRSRGEYDLASHHDSCSAGSSPLSRGIPWGVGDELLGRRIIPALAGNTELPSASLMGTPDHPRSRGEYARGAGVGSPGSGSSPLSRGILAGVVGEGDAQRIIPALAGNTKTARMPPTPPKDHPRSRGEYSAAVVVFVVPPGSSPLSRGIHRPY